MAGGKSNYLENKVLDHVLGGSDYTRPGTVYVGLFRVTPSDSGGGTEITGGSYARVTVTNNSTNFPAAVSGSKSNGTAITFPQATADWAADPNTVLAFGVFDNLTSGNLLYWGPISPAREVLTDDTPAFAAGDLVFTED